MYKINYPILRAKKIVFTDDKNIGLNAEWTTFLSNLDHFVPRTDSRSFQYKAQVFTLCTQYYTLLNESLNFPIIIISKHCASSFFLIQKES